MIISASRRTDIPSFYSEWFFNRLKDGRVCVRNPANPRQISEIPLSADVVDGIVFWTKNPAPMLDRLQELDGYAYYFQFTLNPYGADVEKNVPSKKDIVIPAFRKLSSLIGRDRVVWRYDPVLISEKYTVEYHVKYFRALCGMLSGYTEKCTISFLDMYRGIKSRVAPLGIHAPSCAQAEELAGRFGETAAEYGLGIDACAEAEDLSRFGIGRAACIDVRRLECIGGRLLDIGPDRNQRPACGCAASIDIGAYSTCGNGCVYCYANVRGVPPCGRAAQYDPDGLLLCSAVAPEDTVRARSEGSCSRGLAVFAETEGETPGTDTETRREEE